MPSKREIIQNETARAISNVQAGTIAIARLFGYPADATKFLRGDATWSQPPGTELDYAQITANVTGTTTTEATATPIVTSNSVTYDGTSAVWITGFFPFVSHSVIDQAVALVLWDNTAGVSLGFIGQVMSPAASGGMGTEVKRRITPVAGARIYSIRMFAGTAGTQTVQAGAAGVGNWNPAFISITKA